FTLPGRRTVDQHIEPAKASQRLLNQAPHGLLIRQVRLKADRLDALTLEMSNRLRGLGGGAAVMDRQGVAAPGQRVGHVPAHPALAGARHQSYLGSSHGSPILRDQRASPNVIAAQKLSQSASASPVQRRMWTQRKSHGPARSRRKDAVPCLEVTVV